MKECETYSKVWHDHHLCLHFDLVRLSDELKQVIRFKVLKDWNSDDACLGFRLFRVSISRSIVKVIHKQGGLQLDQRNLKSVKFYIMGFSYV